MNQVEVSTVYMKRNTRDYFRAIIIIDLLGPVWLSFSPSAHVFRKENLACMVA